MTNPVSKDIADLLETNSFGVVGVDIFYGEWGKDSTDEQILIIDTGGPDSTDKLQNENPGFQILTRGTRLGSVSSVYASAKAINTFLIGLPILNPIANVGVVSSATNSPTKTESFSFNHTITADTHLLVITTGGSLTNNSAITSVTYNGMDCIKLITANNSGVSEDTDTLGIYYLKYNDLPSPGEYVVEIIYDDIVSHQHSASNFSNVDQSLPFIASASDSNVITNDTSIVSISSDTGDIVLAAVDWLSGRGRVLGVGDTELAFVDNVSSPYRNHLSFYNADGGIDIDVELTSSTNWTIVAGVLNNGLLEFIPVNDTDYLGFDPISTLSGVGRDENERYVYSMNYITFRNPD